MAEGTNVYFEKQIMERYKLLNSTYPFKDFCKMAVREEIQRRTNKNLRGDCNER